VAEVRFACASKGGRTKFGPNNFLVRTRHEFARHGIVAAVVDAPSDQQAGMSDEFRSGRDHATDMDKVVKTSSSGFRPSRVYLVGTSRARCLPATSGKQWGRELRASSLHRPSTCELAKAAGGSPG
jgi:hypothetical protein